MNKYLKLSDTYLTQAVAFGVGKQDTSESVKEYCVRDIGDRLLSSKFRSWKRGLIGVCSKLQLSSRLMSDVWRRLSSEKKKSQNNSLTQHQEKWNYHCINLLAPQGRGNNFKCIIIKPWLYGTVAWKLAVKLLSHECHRTSIMRSQHWFW